MRYLFMIATGGTVGGLLAYNGYHVSDPIYWAVMIPSAIAVALALFFFETVNKSGSLY
jgi:hypothetical protein